MDTNTTGTKSITEIHEAVMALFDIYSCGQDSLGGRMCEAFWAARDRLLARHGMTKAEYEAALAQHEYEMLLRDIEAAQAA